MKIIQGYSHIYRGGGVKEGTGDTEDTRIDRLFRRYKGYRQCRYKGIQRIQG